MNIRDHERDMLIYHARKDDKRTFADIGRELGITGNRVRQVYRRMDWALNRMNSDHRQKKLAKVLLLPESRA